MLLSTYCAMYCTLSLFTSRAFSKYKTLIECRCNDNGKLCSNIDNGRVYQMKSTHTVWKRNHVSTICGSIENIMHIIFVPWSTNKQSYPWIVSHHTNSFNRYIISKYIKCNTSWLHIKKYLEYINRIYHIWMTEYYICSLQSYFNYIYWVKHSLYW
jgi:hypothetical protein